MQKFKFELGQKACIKISGLEGEVIGRVDYTPPQYFVNFMEAGEAKKEWFFDEELFEVA